jgi:hypothetical protein
MTERQGHERHYRRKRRPPDDAQFAKNIVAIAAQSNKAGRPHRASRARPLGTKHPAARIMRRLGKLFRKFLDRSSRGWSSLRGFLDLLAIRADGTAGVTRAFHRIPPCCCLPDRSIDRTARAPSSRPCTDLFHTALGALIGHARRQARTFSCTCRAMLAVSRAASMALSPRWCILHMSSRLTALGSSPCQTNKISTSYDHRSNGIIAQLPEANQSRAG